jgi:putative transposase
VDESGFLMSPLVRRTLALIGQTPQLIHKVRHAGRGRDKVSVIAALTMSPKVARLGLYFSSLINGYYDSFTVAWFVRQLLRHLRGPVIVVWDGGPMHRGPEIRQLQADFPRLELTSLPAYAPDLNPVECVWSYLKWGKLPNHTAADSEELEQMIFDELHNIRHHHDFLKGFWQGSELPLSEAFNS